MLSECKTVATLRADLTSIADSEFERVNSGNGEWFKMSHDIVMSFEATLSFKWIFKGTILFDITPFKAVSHIHTNVPSGKNMGECDVDYGQL